MSRIMFIGKHNVLGVNSKQTPEMFDRYGPMILNGLDATVPFKEDTELFDIHSYHLGFSDAYGHRVDPSIGMGKCLRPTLCLFVCDALGGSVEQCLDAAISIELIHNFSLIHDDIQDQDSERRHRKTVWKVWGIPKALISGNALHTLGDMATSMQPKQSDHNVALSKLLTNAYMSMIIGQCEDLSFESADYVSVQMYLDMIAGKTGALIQSSIMMGALSATKELDQAKKFEEIGFLLGQAFQIRDDYLGVWGDPAITGKPIGGDIYRKKKTYPVIHGMENVSGTTRKDFKKRYQKEVLSDYDVSWIMAVLEDVGSRQSTLDFIDDISNRAKMSMIEIGLPEWAKEEMGYLIEFLSTRVK